MQLFHNGRALDYSEAVGIGLFQYAKHMVREAIAAGAGPDAVSADTVCNAFVDGHHGAEPRVVAHHAERIHLADFLVNTHYQRTVDVIIAGVATSRGWLTLGLSDTVDEVNQRTGKTMHWIPMVTLPEGIAPGTPVSIARIGGQVRCLT